MNIKSIIITTMTLSFLIPVLSAEPDRAAQKKGKALVKKMVKVVGSYKKLHKLKDVEYTYTYGEISKGATDVSIERYIFHGELSWAKYIKRNKIVMPDDKGEVIQGFDGVESWATLNGQPVANQRELKKADFLRKTNYYWFTMMQKLRDPGVEYFHQGTKEVNGVVYDLVKITFKKGTGDVQDSYLLYINPDTTLVDQFLFTVMDFGMREPLMMKVEYEEIAGIKLPTKRKYIQSNWNGDVKQTGWTDEIMSDIKFTNGFDRSLFAKPY